MTKKEEYINKLYDAELEILDTIRHIQKGLFQEKNPDAYWICNDSISVIWKEIGKVRKLIKEKV